MFQSFQAPLPGRGAFPPTLLTDARQGGRACRKAEVLELPALRNFLSKRESWGGSVVWMVTEDHSVDGKASFNTVYTHFVESMFRRIHARPDLRRAEHLWVGAVVYNSIESEYRIYTYTLRTLLSIQQQIYV